jgi:hypothetical protein
VPPEAFRGDLFSIGLFFRKPRVPPAGRSRFSVWQEIRLNEKPEGVPSPAGKGQCRGDGMFIRRSAVKPIDFNKLKIIDYTAGRENSSSLAEITAPPGVSHKMSWSNRSDKYDPG